MKTDLFGVQAKGAEVVEMSKLKPLVWHKLMEDDDSYWWADATIGEYYVDKKRDGAVWYLTRGEETVSQQQSCSSIAHGKQLCEEDYRRRVAALFDTQQL